MPTADGRRIGLALGSGGALGWAHIGVIQRLEEAGIFPDIVTGCSMGAVVGACYADDKLDVLEDQALDIGYIDMMRLLDLKVFKGGLFGGERIRDLLATHFGRKPIQELARPFATVATDLIAGAPVIFDRGPVVDAVRASIAIPGMLSPVVTGDQVLVDGQITMPVPAALCRDLGADIVIAVAVQTDYLGRTEDLKLAQKVRERKRLDLGAITQAAYYLLIQQYDLACVKREGADVVIAPRTGKFSPLNFTKVTDCVAMGRQAATDALPQIRALAAPKEPKALPGR